jgi:3-hydroxyisobutyrate dehydrogenase-like beta-hydroxyacid dehydrogenase
VLHAVIVTVCGLGLLGAPVARRLAAAGHEVVGWNRRPVPGAPGASTPAAAAARADLVLTVLATPDALDTVVFGPGGLAEGRPAALAQLGTIGCAQVSALATGLPGWTVLDAPVLGSVPQAERGELRLLVGADPAAFARWSPVLAALGEPVHVGPAPAGSALKHVLNAANAPLVALLAEAVALGERLGLDRTLLLDELARSRIGPLVTRKRALLDSGHYPADSRLALFAKDLRLATAEGADVPLTLAGAALRLAEAAEAAGLGELDYSALVGHLGTGEPPCG